MWPSRSLRSRPCVISLLSNRECEESDKLSDILYTVMGVCQLQEWG